MLRVRKCASCGFPVSEGRTLCLDCEKKERKQEGEKPRVELKSNAAALEATEDPARKDASRQSADHGSAQAEEFVPAFLVNSAAAKQSWFSDHINVLAIIVLILGIILAVVVFR